MQEIGSQEFPDAGLDDDDSDTPYPVGSTVESKHLGEWKDAKVVGYEDGDVQIKFLDGHEQFLPLDSDRIRKKG